MGEHENIPPTLEYETPRPKVPWDQTLLRYAPVVCWGIALALYPLFALEILPNTRKTSGSNDPQVYASQWAIAAIAVRATIALIRRDRSWWSLVYIALYFVIPAIADAVARMWRSA